MKKPWDREPTPRLENLLRKEIDFDSVANLCQQMERRMRHAEKLLKRLYRCYCRENELIEPKVGKHFEFAAQEDSE